MDIIIAEDEAISRNLLKEILEMMGHNVLVAEDGLQAWEFYQKNNIKMVIVDLMMPKLDCLGLCKKIRDAEENGFTYTILLTAQSKREDLVELSKGITDEILSKPYSREEIRARVMMVERIVRLEDEHKDFQNILMESRNKLRIVFDSLQEKIVALDDKLNIVSTNQAFLKDAAPNFSNIVGKPFFNDDDSAGFYYGDRIKSLIKNVFKSGEPEYCLDETSNGDGETKYEQIYCLPIKNDVGKVSQVVFVATDITEDKRKSKQIELLNRDLNEAYHQIIEKNEKLERTLKQLKDTQAQMLQSEKMATIGQIAAGVAHEINNPTGFVSSNMETLKSYQSDLKALIKKYRRLISDLKMTAAKTDLSFSIAEQVDEIIGLETEVDIDFIQGDILDLIQECNDGLQRIKKIISDLKDFAHPGENELKKADINKCIESTFNFALYELKYRAKMTKDYGQLPIIKCYPQQLNQVFINMLVNAAQAMEKTGEIKVKTRHVKDNIEITISDDGPGIPEKNLAKIFDPFFTTKDVGKGTGLGLNIAKDIINKHNGTIDVESRVGEGTTFTIHIPVK
jgi:signal transduction histidine kinase/FixJ family two-component response regulator